MQTFTSLAEFGGAIVGSAVVIVAGEVAILIGGAFGAATSMIARERAGRPLVAWEPVVCGIGGAVLADLVVVIATIYVLNLPWSFLDGFSWYLFVGAAQGAFIGLWVALYRTLDMTAPASPTHIDPAGHRRGITIREP